MSYAQYMKHWKNHKKDRFYQQCSGYAGKGEIQAVDANNRESLELTSFKRVVAEAEKAEFPIFICNNGDYFSIRNTSSFLTNEIKSFEELLTFGREYVEGFK